MYRNLMVFFYCYEFWEFVFRKSLKLQLEISKTLQQCEISETKTRLLCGFLYYQTGNAVPTK
jgi:hypothetical protein